MDNNFKLYLSEFQYIVVDILKQDPKRKTHICIISNKRSGERLGSIMWYCPWRCYCFIPQGGTVWNHGCLQDIQKILKELKLQREKERVFEKKGILYE